ncbi:hypothetical protein TPHA_0G03070 [Tetrapisispora phaffii CBS 4417]|uniref:glutaminase n=1 Tax=Tetrapisispora phaffii (strain ATCC 24235 / CBS 4417 / NBRC 1672 / NRRL Y-8282 / UCD 70-5) TaxID=1071381 RepID=G8BW70_TETPH|nr:hypothetical protein TPHA_0G03070 [Tetrapisispora phaffii CBS 4417]CCE64148.1 hypothetical protein TPHA_0G03070 [Tetrapisispora phaffii CBS 4417]
MKNIIIGVLALQGAYIEHVNFLNTCIADGDYGINGFDITVIEVRTSKELQKCNALVIPGGESTSMSLIARRVGIFDDLIAFVHDKNKVIWGTCAGLIFLAKKIDNVDHNADILDTLKLVDVSILRNAFGRQSQSFIKSCDFSSFINDCDDYETVFIRAPVINKILDPGTVKILYSLEYEKESGEVDNLIVAAKQNDNVLITSFHPELSDDFRFHKYFIEDFVLK